AIAGDLRAGQSAQKGHGIAQRNIAVGSISSRPGTCEMSGRPWRSIQHQGAQRAPPDLYDLLWVRRPVKAFGTDSQTRDTRNRYNGSGQAVCILTPLLVSCRVTD